MSQKGKVQNPYESIKVHKNFVDQVRKSKKKTGVPISIFVERAITEKLKTQK